MDLLGFNGLHLDTYGYPQKRRLTSKEEPWISEAATPSSSTTSGRLAATTSSVSTRSTVFREDFGAPPPPSFRYVEVWPPNGSGATWKGFSRAVLAPTVAWGHPCHLPPGVDRWTGTGSAHCGHQRGSRDGAGCEHPDLGRRGRCAMPSLLRRPRDIDSRRRRRIVLDWHRFALRCRDLFRDGTDTSWYELSDENASVTVSWSGESSPEPAVARSSPGSTGTMTSVAVSLLDLSGSHDGSWTSGTGAGACEVADVAILVDAPDQWRAEVSRIGRGGGRFCPLPTASVAMREGRGISCRVPVEGGWAILRLTRI